MKFMLKCISVKFRLDFSRFCTKQGGVMDTSKALKSIKDIHLQITENSLNKNQFNAATYSTTDEAIKKMNSMIPSGSTVSFGGSVTLQDSGLLKLLKKRDDITILDRVDAKSPEEATKIAKKALTCDIFLTSANAVTMDGKLINIDGKSNRVAATLFGPDKVFFMVGKNKIVADTNAGMERIKDIAAPANAKRLNIETPCSKLGRCPRKNVPTPKCICMSKVIQEGSRDPERIHVFLIKQDLGY